MFTSTVYQGLLSSVFYFQFCFCLTLLLSPSLDPNNWFHLSGPQHRSPPMKQCSVLSSLSLFAEVPSNQNKVANPRLIYIS